MNVQDTKDLVQIAVGAVTLFGVACAAFTWVNLRGRKLIHRQIEAIRKEISPNGGKSINDAVRRIEEKMDRLTDGLHFSITLTGEAVWECDEKGECKWASHALCEMFGLTLQEMMGWGWTAAIATQTERNRVSESWKSAVEKKLPYREAYTIHNRGTGERIVVEAEGFHCSGSTTRSAWYFGTINKVHPFRTKETTVETAIAGMKGTNHE